MPADPITGATVWQAPDGTHWRAYGSDDPAADRTLYPVQQDPGTGQWNRTGGPQRRVPAAEFEAYVQVPKEPLRDPRITHLTGLVTTLLADYETAAGRPAPTADAIRAALTDVAAIPEEARKHRHAAAAAAQHAGFHRGRGR